MSVPQTVYGRKTTEEIQERNFAGKDQRKVKALGNSRIFLKQEALPLKATADESESEEADSCKVSSKQGTCAPSERK